MTLETLKKDICSAIDTMRDELLGMSHAIHGEPELALEEFKAAARLSEGIERHGIAAQREAFGLKTAYAAEFGADKGPTVAILSEYDALPGVGHACGHNIIATAGFGAAMALSKLNGRLPGRVRYLGTPAEERYGGKEMMAQEGAFERVDAAMMIHPSNLNLITMPCIAIVDVTVIYHGRAAHASAVPHRGLNALDAVVTAYQSIAQLRQHIKNTDRIHGIITEGGLASNIVPERAACRFNVRAIDAYELAELKLRVHNCFEAGALATGCRAEIKWGETLYLDLKTNWPMADAFERNGKAIGLEFFPMKELPSGYAGSTDMGNVSHRVPSIHPMLGVAPMNVIIHNAEFARHAVSEKGDQAVIDGAKSMAMTTLDFMLDADMQARAKADYAATAELSKAAIEASKRMVADAQGRQPWPRPWRMWVRVRIWLVIAALNGALAVAFGAFAAHGLSQQLDAHALSIFETGARYHMYHALAMGLAALAMQSSGARTATWSAASFLTGIVLFSGSLYALAMTGQRAFAFVTPVGGVSFLAGWVLLALAAWRSKA